MNVSEHTAATIPFEKMEQKAPPPEIQITTEPNGAKSPPSSSGSNTEEDEEEEEAKAKFALEGLTCSTCSAAVEKAVKSLSGVIAEAVSVTLFPTEKLSLTYDPRLISTEDIAEAIESIGFGAMLISNETTRRKTRTRIETAKFALDGLTCSSCVSTVESMVKKLPSVIVESVSVSLFPQERLELDFDAVVLSVENIMEAIEEIGFGANLLSVGGREGNASEEKEKIRLIYIEVDGNVSKAFSMFQSHPMVMHVSIPGKKNISEYELEESGTLQIQYNDDIIHIRTLVEPLKEAPALYGTVTVLDSLSYQSKQQHASGGQAHKIDKWKRSFIFAAIFAIPVFAISMVFMHISPFREALMSVSVAGLTWEELLTWILATPVQFYSGARFYREAYHSMVNGNLGMSFLIALGTSAAYFYSVFAVIYNAKNDPQERLMQAFESSALLIMFVCLGKYLEALAKVRTSKAISTLVGLTPDVATLVGVLGEDGEERSVPETSVPMSLIQRRDILIIRPGEKIPTDGVVFRGSTSVDESMLTGESLPVNKEIGSEMIGGSMNLTGSVSLRVTKVGEDTALSQIIKLVESAQTNKAPIQEYADWIAARFVPFVLGMACLTFVIWTTLLHFSPLVREAALQWPYKSQGFNDVTLPLLFTISVLVIACPCALGLATPTAVMVGTGVGAKNGILIKGGEILELSQKITAVVFDKTGTLTIGCPRVQDIILLSPTCAYLDAAEAKQEGVEMAERSTQEIVDVARENVLFLAACAEYSSEHPLAKGIMVKAAEHGIGQSLPRPLIPATDFSSQTGTGITCTVDSHTIHIGNRLQLEANSINIRPGTDDAMKHLEEIGQTSVVIAVDGTTEAIIGLMDKAKDDACLTINVLRQRMNIEVYMLTGDNKRTAQVLAREIGIPSTHVIADALPADKIRAIQLLQQDGHCVAMIGDGINDSPALVQGDVGVAIGAGTDVAIEAAGVVLVNSKLTDVITMIDLAQTVYKRIKLNFIWALGYNTIAIPLAAGVLYPVIHTVIPPFMAAAAMALSSISVLFSSLLLNLYKPPLLKRKYGRKLRNGCLGLEAIDVLTPADNTLVEIKVQCDCTGGVNCLCSPESCACFPCIKHGNSAVKNTTNDTFPGCPSGWGEECTCEDNCECGSKCEIIPRV